MKSTEIHPCLYGNEHLLRAIQICIAGDLNIGILYSDPVRMAQMVLVDGEIRNILGKKPVSIYDADVIVSYNMPTDFAPRNNFSATRLFVPGDFDTNYSESCQLLIKTAIDRLNLDTVRLIQIKNVAITAAMLMGRKSIAIEDLAEAIHYQNYDESQVLNQMCEKEMSVVVKFKIIKGIPFMSVGANEFTPLEICNLSVIEFFSKYNS